MKSIIVIYAAVIMSTVVPQAQAVPITVGGTDYEVTTIFDTFDNQSALLQSQVWWGDTVAAQLFAEAVFDDLGRSNGIFGPLFAYEQIRTGLTSAYTIDFFGPPPITTARDNIFGTTAIQGYAVATVNGTVPEPSTIALLAAGLFGIGFARRRPS